jgi:hypothetical protein
MMGQIVFYRNAQKSNKAQIKMQVQVVVPNKLSIDAQDHYTNTRNIHTRTMF